VVEAAFDAAHSFLRWDSLRSDTVTNLKIELEVLPPVRQSLCGRFVYKWA
jgi:hypothetical protein